MSTTFKHLIKNEKKYWLAAFFVPVIIMALAYLTVPIYPGSAKTVLASDAFSQFSNFHASFRNMLTSDNSLFYTWNGSLGLNYWSLISYYLGGIFTPLVLLLPTDRMPDTLYFLTLIKLGCAGLSFWYFSRQIFSYKLPILHVSLSTMYALMAFNVAHSELIMWLDAFVWFPLILLGIHSVMDEKKPLLLFVSYFLLFVSNFYFGFMIGVFSVCYFAVRLFGNWRKYKQSIVPYFITSFLAGMASMIMILPTLFDLRSNGEALSELTKLKTADSDVFDLVVKNMVGVFDTTKYGSIPFIYAGLVPLLLVTFYFISNKFSWKNKILTFLLFSLLIASFYLEPLNLFWHGFHSPNMFLFRFSFLFSTFVLVIAGHALEKVSKTDVPLFIGINILWMLLFIIPYLLKTKTRYAYVTKWNLLITLAFLLAYLVILLIYRYNTNKYLGFFPLVQVLLVSVCGITFLETSINTAFLVQGILNDWNYPSRSLYTSSFNDYKTLIETTKENNQTFFRTENIDPISSNDSFHYDFHGVSMFSSIRNRNTSSLLNELGFRSRGTNLNIRYANNTLVMDSLLGIQYNLSKQPLNKFGFDEVSKNDAFYLYENKYAMNLGVVTDDSLFDVAFPENDNLISQRNLLASLSKIEADYFTYAMPNIIKTENATLAYTEKSLIITEEKQNIGKTITWKITVPAGKQAYLSLYPTNFSQLKNSTAELMVNGQSSKTQIDINGQYLNLGYYPTQTDVTFSVNFYGTDKISIIEPPVMLLDIPLFQDAMKVILDNDVAFDVSGRKASATVTVPKDSNNKTLLTTIPYDRGWQVKINDKKVAIKSFKDAFITIPLTTGENNITLTFLPQGFRLGAILCIICISLFILYWKYCKKNPLIKGED